MACSPTAACQLLFKLLQQRWPLAKGDSSVTQLFLSWGECTQGVKGQRRAKKLCHIVSTLFALGKCSTGAQLGSSGAVYENFLCCCDTRCPIFSTQGPAELDTDRQMKAEVQGRQTIVGGLIALLREPLEFPFVFEHFGLRSVIFQKLCG